jgi:hypothetical protein
MTGAIQCLAEDASADIRRVVASLVQGARTASATHGASQHAEKVEQDQDRDRNPKEP